MKKLLWCIGLFCFPFFGTWAGGIDIFSRPEINTITTFISGFLIVAYLFFRDLHS